MSVLDKIAKAKTFEGGNWINDGEYSFLVEKIAIIEAHSGTCFVAELYVETSAPTEDDTKPNAPGSSASFVQNFKHDSAPGNTKAFMLAALAPLGYTEAEFNAALLDEAKGDEQPLRGVRLIDRTYRGTIKKGANAGKPITKHRWSAVEQTPEDIAAARAFLDDRMKGPSTAKPTPETKTEEPVKRTSMLSKLSK